MKHLSKSSHYDNNSKIYKRTFLWFLLSLAFAAMLLFPSFSITKLTSSSSILPFSEPVSFEPTAINCKINQVMAEGFKTKEANFYKMEQTAGIFAKVLNMSLEDGDGNLFALSLTDLENAELDSCLTTNFFFGNKHKKNEENFSYDLGSSVFSNSSSLIFEKKDGSSLISRDGWIKINRCEQGRISGGFYFKIEEGKSTEFIEGEFVNVLLEME